MCNLLPICCQIDKFTYAFKDHIQKYHSVNGRGDGSLHEENGYWFKVTDEFYSYIMSL